MGPGRFKTLWQGAFTIGAGLLLWHIASNTGLFGRTTPEYSRLLLPPPSAVLSSLIDMVRSGYLLGNVSISILRVVAGFLIAVVIAVPLGISMALSPNIHSFTNPIVRLLSPIPGVAWVPIAILWFGLGDEAAIFIIAIGSIFPILLNTIQGVHDTDKRLIDSARTMGATRLQVVHRVMLPSLAPYLVTGFRTGLSFAWRVVIAAELVGVPKGLGYMLTVGRSTGRTEITIVTMLVLGALMIAFEELVFSPLAAYTDAWRGPHALTTPSQPRSHDWIMSFRAARLRSRQILRSWDSSIPQRLPTETSTAFPHPQPPDSPSRRSPFGQRW